jgi:hypothetical protein
MPHPWAVRDAQTGTLVGFAMISDNTPPPIDGDLIGPCYLWKLLIDHRCQRCGYGFTDTGRVMWEENVLALDLAARR